MEDTKQCCGTCRYGYCNELKDYVCVNDDSEHVADYVDYEHICDDYTEI